MVIVSKNSMILKEALHRRRVKFQEEYSHDGRLRFDIAIFSGDGPNRENLVCLIEYDGEQHYTDKVIFDDKNLKERDKEKEEWCKQNEIPLIRIREQDFPSPESIYSFVDSKLIPALPHSSMLPIDRDFSEIETEKLGQKIVVLDTLVKETYSIKDVANLLDYSSGYISDRIRNFAWFKNWSGNSNLEVSPYSIDREDLIRGLSFLQFLVDENGNRIPPLDDSHLAEIISELNKTETIKEKMLLICNKFQHNNNNKIRKSTVEILTNPNVHESVRKILTDEYHTVVFYGSSKINSDDVTILEETCHNLGCDFIKLEDYVEKI